MGNWEIIIIQALRDAATTFFDNLFKLITIFGEKEIIIIVVLFVYFFFSKKAGQKMAYGIFSSILLNNSIKGLVARPRPWTHPYADYDPVHPETATGYSFPSGHAQGSAAIYSSIAIETKKKYINVISAILILLVGFSRIYLGVHYPTDVIAGIILGIGCVIFTAYIHTKFENSFKKQLILYLTTFFLFLPFVPVFWEKNSENILAYRDFYTIFAFFCGYIAAFAIESVFVNFTDKASITIKIIRTILAVLLAIAVLFGLKMIFPKDSIIFDMLRYFLIPIVVIGLYPLAGKNTLFKTL